MTININCLTICSTLQSFLQHIPGQRRSGIQEAYCELTIGLPLHSHQQPCPLSRNDRLRNIFLHSCPNPLGYHRRQILVTNIIKAYKSHQLCFSCGAPRPARREKNSCLTPRSSSSSLFTAHTGQIMCSFHIPTAYLQVAIGQPSLSGIILPISSTASSISEPTPYTNIDTRTPLTLFQNHSCIACSHIKNPFSRSYEHYRLFKGQSPQTLPNTIQPPLPLPPKSDTKFYTHQPPQSFALLEWVYSEVQKLLYNI